jgi:hypothetical protein
LPSAGIGTSQRHEPAVIASGMQATGTAVVVERFRLVVEDP